jgi:hypothetical protein
MPPARNLSSVVCCESVSGARFGGRDRAIPLAFGGDEDGEERRRFFDVALVEDADVDVDVDVNVDVVVEAEGGGFSRTTRFGRLLLAASFLVVRVAVRVVAVAVLGMARGMAGSWVASRI